ncbi:MAG: alpha/beta hydrolase [Candidatus Eremiobacteraeota bacterium]|nr:alpha/beta hydrolase [Candidatus Eremiobacteraeota bacterium]
MFDLAAAPNATHVDIEGRRLEVVTYEPKGEAQTTIVMLHEGLGSVALWKDVPAQLARRTGARVIAYSRYGYGASDVLREARDVRYMHHEGEVVLPALLARLGVVRPVLFGHSDGASIALIYAGAHPDGVAGLVLEAPHVFVEDHSIRGISAAAQTYRSSDLPAKLGRYHADVERTFWGWNEIWLDPRFRAWNIDEYVERVTCPVLLVQGYDDEYGTQAQLHAIAARVRDTTTVMLEECGHSPHRDRPQATLDATAAFVARVEGSVT